MKIHRTAPALPGIVRPAALAGLVLLVPLLAACGGGATDGATNGAAPEERTGEVVADEAPGDDETAADPGTGGTPSLPPAGMCAAELVFEGTTYTMSGDLLPEGDGEPVGTATIPPCGDTPGADGDQADDAGVAVEVFAVPGRPAEEAIASGGSIWTATP